MLMPKRTKYRKSQRGRMKGISKGALKIDFGEYALSAMESGFISNRQIEAARVAIIRYIKRGGKIWFRIFPDYPVTKKPAETRMGKGKGNPEGWVCRVKRGRVLVELSGVDEVTARAAMRLASYKLSIRTQFFVRKEIQG